MPTTRWPPVLTIASAIVASAVLWFVLYWIAITLVGSIERLFSG